jgi:hypothetical protein
MLRGRSTLLAAAVACAALAVPAVAAAEDFCVGAPAGCSGTAVAAGELKAALAAAQSNGTDDRFFIAPGDFTADQFAHQSSERVQIIGAGAGATILHGSLADEPSVALDGNPGSSIAGLTIAAGGDARAGILLGEAQAHGVTVDAQAITGTFVAGVALRGGATFDGGRVELGTSDQYAALVLDTGTVTGSTLVAPAGTGVGSFGSTATVRRSTLKAPIGAVVAAGGMTISDSVIDLRGFGAAFGAAAIPGHGGVGTSARLDLDRVTIFASTPDGKVGVLANADGAGMSASASMRDSVVSGVATPIARSATNGASFASMSTDRSDYPAATSPVDVGPGSLVEQHRLDVAPGFVDAAGGDFHLAPASPLIDAGTPGLPPAGTADRDGNPRASDGDGDCSHVSDIGAFERQGTVVRAVATAGAARVTIGQPVGFSAAGSCIPGTGAPIYAWSFDDGATAAGAAVSHAFASPGRHSATLTVSDGAGHQAVAGAAVDVATAPPPPAPVISGLRVTPRRIPIGSLLPKLVSRRVKRPAGTIRFTLSEPATVRLRFTRLGRNGRTRAVKKRLRLSADQGLNRIRFAARLSRRVRLRPGAYRLTMIARDASGARSEPATARFRAIRARRG